MQREELHAARAPGLRAPRARSAAAPAAAAQRSGPGGLAAPLAAAALLCLARGAAAAGLAFGAGAPSTLALAALRPDAAEAAVSFENTVREESCSWRRSTLRRARSREPAPSLEVEPGSLGLLDAWRHTGVRQRSLPTKPGARLWPLRRQASK